MPKPELPKWASEPTYTSGLDNGLPTRLEPTEGEQENGFFRGRRAPARKLNWIVGLLCDWAAYLSGVWVPYHLDGAFRFPKTLAPNAHDAFCFSSNGTLFYELDDPDVIIPWSTPPWDQSDRTLASGTYGSLDISAQVSNGSCLRMSPDGTQLFVSTNAGTIHRWTLSTPWDLDSASYVGNSGTIIQTNLNALFTVNGFGFDFSEDGGHLIVAARDAVDSATESAIADFDLSTEWDISAPNFQGFLDVFSADGSAQSVVSQNDGKVILVLGTDHLRTYYLDTASDSSSGVLHQTLDISSALSNARVLAASPDGTKAFASASSGTNPNRIYTWYTTKFIKD